MYRVIQDSIHISWKMSGTVMRCKILCKWFHMVNSRTTTINMPRLMSLLCTIYQIKQRDWIYFPLIRESSKKFSGKYYLPSELLLPLENVGQNMQRFGLKLHFGNLFSKDVLGTCVVCTLCHEIIVAWVEQIVWTVVNCINTVERLGVALIYWEFCFGVLLENVSKAATVATWYLHTVVWRVPNKADKGVKFK